MEENASSDLAGRLLNLIRCRLSMAKVARPVISIATQQGLENANESLNFNTDKPGDGLLIWKVLHSLDGRHSGQTCTTIR